MNVRIYKPAAVNQITKAMLKDRRVSIVVENFHGVNWHDKTKAFPCFVVYDSPKDAPGKYVVRLFDGALPTRLITLSDTLEDARRTIPTEPTCFMQVPRSETDRPQIVETWL